MRLVVTDFMSLDGVVQAPGGPDEDTDGGFVHGGWSMPLFDVETMGAAIDEDMTTTDALLFGRRTWQAMAAAWPERAGDPYADAMNSAVKYVASRSLSPDDVALWNNSSLLTPVHDIPGAVSRLKAQPGRNITVWGSAELVRLLVAEGLVDEYRLMIAPLLLGGGKRIFPDDGIARHLKLASVTTASTGVLVATYVAAVGN